MKIGDKVRIKKKPELVYTILNDRRTAHSIWYELDEPNLKWYDADELIMTGQQAERTTQEQGLRYNEGKDDWSLIHYASLRPLVQVLMFGAKKYAPHNWMKGFSRESILNSAMRHMVALIDGQENDEETKLSHAGHIMCNMMFYVYHFVLIKDEKEETRTEFKPDQVID